MWSFLSYSSNSSTQHSPNRRRSKAVSEKNTNCGSWR